jgi:NADPH:quinone reductase
MKAAWYTTQGPAREVLQIGEMPDPQPGAGEVRVRVHASGINPTDMYGRSGSRRRGMAFERIIPHQDGAGVIDAVGAGVPRERIGERVWLYMAQWQRAFGTGAEYITLPSDRAVLLPGKSSFLEGACLGVPWLTAHWAVVMDGSVAGQTVLVAGGTGAVGIYCIQIAKAKGARVIATVGSAEKGATALAAGADAVIDFRSEDVGARVAALTDGQGVERLLEPQFSLNAPLFPKIMKKRGTVVVYGAGGPEGAISSAWGIQNQPTIRFIYMYELPADAYKHAVADYSGLAINGKVRHLPIRTFSLAEIALAHEAVEKGNSGVRMVLDLAPR